MYLFLQKLPLILLFVLILRALPLQAQEKSKMNHNKPFIEQGIFLTGFSLSFINASRDDFNQEFAREITDITAQLDGLYFVDDHLGIGPLLGYRFTYRDLVDRPIELDEDQRRSRLEFGAQVGWYMPARKLFGGSGRSQFFIDGDVSFVRFKNRLENNPEPDADYRFGYQVGTGFLFPVGKRIAVETKLGFQARQREYTVGTREEGGEKISITETKWLKEVALSVGLKVTF